jgi:hypothetical protein
MLRVARISAIRYASDHLLRLGKTAGLLSE